MNAGVLFWKLFGTIGLSLIGTLVLGGLLIALGVQHIPSDPPTRVKLAVAADLAAVILARESPEAAEQFIAGLAHAGIFGKLDGRCVPPPDSDACTRIEAESDIREAVRAGDDHEIVLSSHDSGHSFFLPPIDEPLFVGVPVGLLAALLLARHIVTPITILGQSVRQVAEGRFDVRVSRSVSNRHDEIGDLSRDIDRMATRLERVTLGQKRLFHDVSHELQSPLFRLKAAVALTRKMPDRLEDMLSRFDREIDRMSGLVEEILTLARFEAGEDHFVRELVDPARLLEDVLDDADFEARQKSLEIQRHIERGSVCLCSPELVRRAFENIVRNALKFSPPGHVVDIRAARDLARGVLRVEIRDEGPGMSEEERASAFEPFYRGNPPDLSRRGYGLGLSIAKRAAEDAGGVISAEVGEGGLGTTIRLELPMKSPSKS